MQRSNRKNAAGKPRKRILLVNREFQGRYVFYAVFLGVISTLSTGFIILFPLYVFEILSIPRFLPTPFLLGMVVVALINILIIAIVTFLITHKIAGPLYALVRNIKEVERGNWTAVLKFREGDELLYVARNFNGMLESLVKNAKEDLSLCMQLESRITAMKVANTLSESEHSKLQELIQRLQGGLQSRLNGGIGLNL
ncbi:MAG: hypothetical protein KBD78_09665 [Oligoflexales bacterium]|nr:hypothetical protein [Oligoflexales bacterium]